MKYNDLIFTYG